MYNSFTLCPALFSREGNIFFKVTFAPIVTVLFSRTKKRAVCFCNRLQIKSFFIYWAGAEKSMNIAI